MDGREAGRVADPDRGCPVAGAVRRSGPTRAHTANPAKNSARPGRSPARGAPRRPAVDNKGPGRLVRERPGLGVLGTMDMHNIQWAGPEAQQDGACSGGEYRQTPSSENPFRRFYEL